MFEAVYGGGIQHELPGECDKVHIHNGDDERPMEVCSRRDGNVVKHCRRHLHWCHLQFFYDLVKN